MKIIFTIITTSIVHNDNYKLHLLTASLFDLLTVAARFFRLKIVVTMQGMKLTRCATITSGHQQRRQHFWFWFI